VTAGQPGAAGFLSGISTVLAEMVSIREAIEAAFCRLAIGIVGGWEHCGCRRRRVTVHRAKVVRLS
jgi:hypothetical protein